MLLDARAVVAASGELCLLADGGYLACAQMLPPCGYVGQPATSYATKFVHVSVNKVRDLALGCMRQYSTAHLPVRVDAARGKECMPDVARALSKPIQTTSSTSHTCLLCRCAAASTWRCGRRRGGAA